MPQINLPTRITGTSSTLIGNILIYSQENVYRILRTGEILPQFLLKNKTREWTGDVTHLIGGRMSLGKGETNSQIRTL